MKIAIAMTLMLQMGSIGFSASVMAKPGITPAIFGIHATLIAVNLLFGAVNVRELMR